MEIARILKNLSLLYPRARHNIFSGTNIDQEWWATLKAWQRGETPGREEEILAYEEEFARAIEVSHAFSFGAGRMAFYAILEAMNIGPEDEVILPAYTCWWWLMRSYIAVPSQFMSTSNLSLLILM